MKYIFFIGLDLVLYPFLVLLYICQLIYTKPRAFFHHNEGGANKDLAKFADQINALCDKWDR